MLRENLLNQTSRALGAVLAINTQVAAIIAAGFWGEAYLEQNWPQTFKWVNIMVPLALLGVLQSYYVMFRYLVRLEKAGREKKDV